MRTARLARERSPGDSSASARSAWSAPRSNLASSDRASCGVRPAWTRTRSSRLTPPGPPGGRRDGVGGEGVAGLAEVAHDHAGAEAGVAGVGGQLAGEQAQQGGLAGAVRAGDGEAVLPGDLEVHGPEPETAEPDPRTGEGRDDVAAAARGPERHPQLLALPGLLGSAEPLDPALQRLGGGGGRGGPVPAPGRQGLVVVGGPIAAAADAPFLAAADGRLQPRTLLLGLLESGVDLLPTAATLLDVGVVAAAVLAETVADQVQLGHPRGGGRQERPVVAHQHDPAADPAPGPGGGPLADQETFQPVEPGEVEVVGRLVEQEHVEAGEQDGGQA